MRRSAASAVFVESKSKETIQKMERVKVLRDNREIDDRRQFDWRTVVLGYARSRRRGHRRQTEIEPMFSDWHHPWLFFLATGTMLLSSLDAFFTLKLLSRGAVEVNPIMAAVMGHSTTTFAVTKMILTGLGIMALVYLARSMVFNRVRTGIFLTMFFSFYCCLVVYEFLLLISIP
jgi:hypothetical protein